MLRTDPAKDRRQLDFKDAALASFGFLRTYSLKPVEEDVTFVRYESPAVFVNVFHGRGSLEVGVEIGRLDRTEKYGLDYIVSWAGKYAWESEGFGRGTIFQVSTREGVQAIVPKVAAIVKKYGDPFLSGQPAFYDELQRANERASVAYERDQTLNRLCTEADVAWKAKDFARVAELLQPVRADLTEVVGKRLAYAEKYVYSAAQEMRK
jgi:hypothetical protein